MEWSKDPGSFRDPSGFVFSADGIVYRQVNATFAEQYRRFVDSGLYADLTSNGLIVPHEEVGLRLEHAPPAATVLKPQRIPFISYPYEWCFSQLKAAALLTLDVHRRALERGFVLRDASAFNVQFLGTRAVFIDSLSFGPEDEDRPWAAYRQFCEHFLAPLALVALVDPTLGQLSRLHLDGVPLDLASRLLPVSSRLRPGLLMHLHAHATRMVRGRAQHGNVPDPARGRRMGRTAMLGLVESLGRTVENLSWSPPDTLWSTYTDHLNYPESAQALKQHVVADWLERVGSHTSLRTIWDVGANTGTYSRLAAEQTGALVVSFDLDQASVERHFRACRARDEGRILPLIQDLTNPSAAVGWNHGERRSLKQRGPADVVMALALVHHLAISANIPLASIAAFFHQMCSYLIVEFVPKEDSQVQRMLAMREDVFADYSKDGFESAFGAHFDLLQSISLEHTVRTLYLMKRR